MGNVKNMGENIQGKNNKELTDKNVSGEDPFLYSTVNEHIHSGGKGLYSYGMKKFDDEKSDKDNLTIQMVIIQNNQKIFHNSMKQ